MIVRIQHYGSTARLSRVSIDGEEVFNTNKVQLTFDASLAEKPELLVLYYDKTTLLAKRARVVSADIHLELEEE